MIILTNLLNRPRVVRLKNGKSFRLLAYQGKVLEEGLLSESMKVDIEKGLLSVAQVPEEIPVVTESIKEEAEEVKPKEPNKKGKKEE